jgi:hypothetical protein
VCVWGGGGCERGCRLQLCFFAHVALLIQRAVRISNIVVSASLAPPNFSILSHKQDDFGEKVTENKMSVLILSTTFIRNVSHSENNSERYRYKCKKVFMLFLSDFNIT